MSEFKTDDDFLDQPMDFGDLPPDPEAVSILFLFLLKYRKKWNIIPDTFYGKS